MNAMVLGSDLLQVAFEHAPCAIVITKNRRVLECNHAFCDLFGYERQKLIGQLMLKLYPSYADFKSIGELRYKDLLQNKKCIDERFMRNSRGEVFWTKTIGNTLTPDSPFELAVWSFMRINVGQDKSNDLTMRELEVSGYIANGHTCKEIGRLLHISHRTVEAHRAKIMKKLGCRNTAELVSKIIQLDD
ncbi:MAG: PAS domain S-box protein [Gammaproteobacteria bacterium]|uniref:LuxR C-terminal-related transcriptional regulator n=1 Tax=Vreelandella venusta TaxID=44935 RepID=UPI004044D3B1|nr:PAS domain S-box protein [Gammaproteobacteria bacterium]